MLRFEGVVTVKGEQPFDADLAPSSGLLLVGPSGTARTRLLQVAAGLIKPHAGRVLLEGRPLAALDVGFVDEDRSLIGGLTAAENVVARVLGQGPLADRVWSAVEDSLRRIGIPESGLHNLAEQLSGGQQQRVALARALFGSPPVLCLDDPVSELDESSAALVWSILSTAVQEGAVLLVGMPEVDDSVPVDRIVHLGTAAET